MRRVTILFLILSLLSVGFASSVMAQDEMEGWTCPEGFEGQTLRFFNWSTYVAEDTVPNFEAACNVTVETFEYGSDEEMLTVVRTGTAQYDIVVPSGDAVATMIEEGLAQPLDKDAIPNMANISETFLDPPYDPGNEYSVPYQWGTIGFGYDVNLVGEISSWEELFAYDGPVAWLNDQRAMLGVALMLLGYDPNSENPDEIAEAGAFLGENSANVDVIADDNGQDLLLQGNVDITVEYSGDIFQIIDDCGCDDYAYVIPSDGTNIWTDNLVVLADAPNSALAMVFVDYILDAHVGADISNFTAYGTPNQASLDQGLIDEELLNNPGIYPSDETRERLFFATGVSSEADQAYEQAWSNLQASMSG